MRINMSEEEKGKLVDEWVVSGKSVQQYARENGVHPKTFWHWTKRKADVAQTRCFTEVPVQKITPHRDTQMILIEKGDMRIHLPLFIGATELRTVLSALGGGV